MFDRFPSLLNFRSLLINGCSLTFFIGKQSIRVLPEIEKLLAPLTLSKKLACEEIYEVKVSQKCIDRSCLRFESTMMIMLLAIISQIHF